MPKTGQHYGGIVRPAAILALLLGSVPVRHVTGQAKPQAEGVQQQAGVPSSQDRQKAMQADVDRLLDLARRLKQEVDNSRKDELSVKVIRDADDIDKLARSARGRIR